MDYMITRIRFLLGAAALLALVIVPVALAATGGDSGGPQATASGVKQKVKKLTQRVAALEAQLAGVTGEQGGARPPTGPAGGDLTGTYPNPLIAANAIGSAEVQPNSLIADDLNTDSVGADEIATDAVNSDEIAGDAVGSSEIATNAVNSSEIATGAVDSDELGDNAHLHTGTVVTVGGGAGQNGAYVIGQSTAICAGGEEIISAYGEWTNDGNPAGDEELTTSEVDIDTTTESATAQGGNDFGTDRNFRAVAVCI